MRLIVDIPNGLYANLAKISNGSIAGKRIIECVKHGNPHKVDVLDKIRAEITAIAINEQVDEHTAFIRTGEQVKQMALEIIDKYTKGEHT